MADFVNVPTPADLAVFLGWGPFDTELAEQAAAHLERARLTVKAFTRGRGFSTELSPSDQVAPDIAQVILTLAGRSLNNPTSAVRTESGAFSSVPGIGELSLGDRLTLANYRRTAA